MSDRQSNLEETLPKKEKIKSSSSEDGKERLGTSFKTKIDSGFCWCTCFSTEAILDSETRKDTWFRLVPGGKKNFEDDISLSSFENQIVDPLRVLKHLYSRNNENSIEMLKACRLNPDLDPCNIMREDLEFYIPQLCNFIIFHEDFKNLELNSFLQEACEINFFFSHLVYWCLKSLSKLIKDKNTFEEFPIIYEPLDCIVDICSEDSKNKFLLAYTELHELLQSFPNAKTIQQRDDVQELIQNYGTIKFHKSSKTEGIVVKASDIILKNYSSVFEEKEEISGFLSTVNFCDDLIKVSEEIVIGNKKERLNSLRQKLQKVNEKLPSAVYIPFFKNGIRNYAVLNIVVEEAIVFSTKERAPYYICIEIFRPEEDYSLEKSKLEQDKALFESQSNNKKFDNFIEIDKHLSKPITIKENPKKLHPNKFRNSMSLAENEFSNSSKRSKPIPFRSMISEREEKERTYPKTYEHNIIQQIAEEEEFKHANSEDFVTKKSGTSIFYGEKTTMKSPTSDKTDPDQDKENIPIENKKLDIPIAVNTSSISNSVANSFEVASPKKKKKKQNQLIFGEDSEEQKERIKENSVFKNLKTWDLVHLIVKSHDNLKQEQFALQLIYQFDQIFKAENLNLKLRPYEVLSLGPDCGLIEMIKDSITMDALKRKIYENYKDLNSLNQFFQFHYGNELEKARNNFCSSLAAYSLVCYILQIKDRHNCNILLHKDGYLVHIDFGFFLSNMPGKGLEFEKPVPFKFLTEYLDVLGGRNSTLFSKFRKLFFQGFKAVRKHKDKILLLVKMMYSIHGNTLPCFKTGEKCIQELEDRFEPKGIKNEGELNIFIQNLVDLSLDNLRTKWYDKFQYYFQGIFY